MLWCRRLLYVSLWKWSDTTHSLCVALSGMKSPLRLLPPRHLCPFNVKLSAKLCPPRACGASWRSSWRHRCLLALFRKESWGGRGWKVANQILLYCDLHIMLKRSNYEVWVDLKTTTSYLRKNLLKISKKLTGKLNQIVKRDIEIFFKCFSAGLFEIRAHDYLDSLPGAENRGVNKFLKGLGKCLNFKWRLAWSNWAFGSL